MSHGEWDGLRGNWDLPPYPHGCSPAGPGHQPSHHHDLLAEETAWPGAGPGPGTQGKSGWSPASRAEDRPPGPDRPAAPHPPRRHGTAALVLSVFSSDNFETFNVCFLFARRKASWTVLSQQRREEVMAPRFPTASLSPSARTAWPQYRHPPRSQPGPHGAGGGAQAGRVSTGPCGQRPVLDTCRAPSSCTS